MPWAVGCLLLCGLICLTPSETFAQSVSALFHGSSSSSGGTPSISRSISFDLPLADRNALSLSAEYVQDTSFPEAFGKVIKGRPSWKITAVPITLGYTHFLASPRSAFVPTVGFGVSYYFCRTNMLEVPAGYDFAEVYSEASMPEANKKVPFNEQLGMGYGAQITLGVQIDVSRDMFIIAQSRGRYVNGLGFSHSAHQDLNSEFAKVDFSLGMGLKL